MKHASIFIHKKIQEKIRIIHRNNRWDRTQVINTPTRRDKTHLHNSLQKKIKKNRTLLKKKLLNLFMVYIFVVIHQCPSFTINNKYHHVPPKTSVWCIFNLSKMEICLISAHVRKLYLHVCELLYRKKDTGIVLFHISKRKIYLFDKEVLQLWLCFN
jgi:hypothetical protein